MKSFIHPNFRNYLQTSSLYILALFTVLGLVIYGRAIYYPFVHDDFLFIVHNPQIGRLDLASIFLSPASAQLHELANLYYRPVLELVTRLEFKVFHFNAAGYHLVNILIHILNSFLVFIDLSSIKDKSVVVNTAFSRREERSNTGLLSVFGWEKASKTVQRLTDRAGLPLTVSILFLCHPVQTEAVASIAGMSNTLTTFFILLAFYFYLESRRVPGKTQATAMAAGSLLTYFLAVFVKEQAVVFPLIIILHEILFPKKAPLSERIVLLSGFIAAAVGFLWLRQNILSTTTSFLMDGEFFLRILSIPRTLLTYVMLLLFPVNLHYYRNADILQPFVVPLIILFCLVAAVIWFIRKMDTLEKGLALFGLGWFLITLLPVSNIVPLVNEYSLIMTAEHFLYVPSMGFFIFLAAASRYGFRVIFRREADRAALAAVTALSFVFLLASIKQVQYWRGEVPLFERTMQFEKGFGRGYILLARAYYAAGDYQRAIAADEQALGIMNGYAAKVKDEGIRRFYLGFIKGIHFDMAHSFEALGQLSAAVTQYEEALALDAADGVLYNNLGAVYLQMQDIDRAMANFQKAAALNKNDFMALNNLAICYIEKNDLDQAEVILKDILNRAGRFDAARENLIRLEQRKAQTRQEK